MGPDWPLGFIKVVTPGTPVSIMSVVDPNNYDAPGTLTKPQSNEYTVRCYRLTFMGYQPVASPGGFTPNAGNVYIMRAGVGGGLGNYTDTGALVKVLAPAETYEIDAAALNRNVFSPYRYYLDADTANDGAMVTLWVQ